MAVVKLNESVATIGSKTDNLYTFESITGTNYNDILIGDDSNVNRIYGLTGDD